jgi:hypothetical protein
MTAKRTAGIGRSVPGKPPERHAKRLNALRRAGGRPQPTRGSQPVVPVQLALEFPTVPQPRREPGPLPVVPKRAGPARDRLEALCRCPPCGNTFADETCLRAHRPKGACLDPRAAGLTRQTQPMPCWGQPKETR